MLTARGALSDRVSGLRMGADDYLPRPFEMAELMARIEALLRHAGEVLPRERLLREVWDFANPPQTRTVDVHISLLRRKLEPDPGHVRHFRTVHGVGVGYRFLP